MCAVDVLLVAKTVQIAQPIAPTAKRHFPAPHQTRAEHDKLVDKPIAREIGLALLRVVSSSAMAQRNSLALVVQNMYVMLL